MEKVTISKLDNYGRGICYVNDKITFVFNALPNEKVIIDKIEKYPKYQEARVVEYEKIAINREEPICPYFNICGGCQLMHMSYEDTIAFKEDNIKRILNKYANYNGNITMNASPMYINYRNKVTLKIKDYKIGYYEESSHQLVEIKECIVAKKIINKFIMDIKKFNIENGSIVIRCNYKDELLISINTNQRIKLDKEILTKYNIVGIVLNDETIYGNNYFIDKINDWKFKVSYNSFFQINPYTTSIIFNKMRELVDESDIALDLYCGVGTLGINIADKVNKLYGVEVVENAIIDAKYNATANILNNTNYLCGNVKDIISRLPKKVDLIIIDPPRSGIDKETLKSILRILPRQIIYMSCDIMTMARDLNILREYYDIESFDGYDMFPYTYHVESVSVLTRKY